MGRLAPSARSAVARLQGLTLLCAAACATLGQARAGPWITDAEDMLIASVSPAISGAGGAGQVYVEDVLARRRLSLVTRNYGVVDDTQARLETEARLKASFRPTASSAISAEIGPALVEDPLDPCARSGIAMGLGAGRSFRNGAYVAGEVAQREFGQGCHGTRAELTLGRSRGDMTFLAQIFADAAPGGRRSVKGEISGVRFWGRLGLQIGVRETLSGKASGPAFVVGLWVRGPSDR